MNKIIALAFLPLLIIFSQSIWAAAPLGVKGQADTAKQYPPVITVPNKQATKITGGTLIETGNKNLLQNPSFEALPVPTLGWTSSPNPILVSADLGQEVVDGKYALEFHPNDQPFEHSQCSTINAAGFAEGVDGHIKAWVKVSPETNQDIEVCHGTGGVYADSDCVTVPKTGRKEEIGLPVILGPTSNCITARSKGYANVTGNIWVDDFKVAPGRLTGVANKIESQTLKLIDYAGGADLNNGVMDGSGLFTVSGDTITAQKRIEVDASISSVGATTSNNGFVNCGIRVSGTTISSDISRGAGIGFTQAANCSASLILNPGETMGLSSGITSAGSQQTDAVIIATAAEQYEYLSGKASSFSTDTTTLTFKSTAITSSDPVGTYNTFMYAQSTVDKVICGTAPATPPTREDGIKISTRIFSANSDCSNPARFEIKIAQPGTKLPDFNYTIYKNPASGSPRIPGNLDLVVVNGTTSWGLFSKDYDESTGVATFDAGRSTAALTNSALILFSDNSLATSGYLVINAQKMKDTMEASFTDFDYVWVKARSNNNQSIGATQSTFIFEDVSRDNNGWYNASTGKFKPKIPGIYSVKSLVQTANVTLSSTERFFCYVYVNNNPEDHCSKENGTGGVNSYISRCDADVDLQIDDEVEVKCTSSVATTSLNSRLTITRLPGQF